MSFMLRQIKENSINWFPHLQTVLPKLYVEGEQGPSECWVMMVVAPGRCQLLAAMVAFSPPLAILLSFSSFLVTPEVAADCFVMVSTATSRQWWGPSFFNNNGALRSVAYLGNELPLLALSPVKKRWGKREDFTWASFSLFFPDFSREFPSLFELF